MKRILSLLTLLLFIGTANAQNPFEKFGYTPKIGTLSKGKYIEHFDTDSIVQIGSVLFNPFTKKITGFVTQETVYSEATLKPEIVSRWLNPDPLAEEFYDWSPYNFVRNNPVLFVDPDGRFAIPFTDLFDKNGNKIGTDGVNNGVNVVVNNSNLAKQVKQISGEEGTVDLLDNRFSFSGSDITVLPSESALAESVNVLDRQVANGGLNEESSKIVNSGRRVLQSPTGTAPTLVSDGKGGFVATAETIAESAPLLPGEKVTTLIHSHPTKALEKNGSVFPFSANTPSAADQQSFKNQQTNIIVGPISGTVTRNANGTLNDTRTLGVSIFNSNSQLQISLPKRVVKKIIQ